MTCINNISKPIKCNNSFNYIDRTKYKYYPKTRLVFDEYSNFLGTGKIIDNILIIKLYHASR